MLNALIDNLVNIGWAMLIFLCAYLSNVSFSLYYNIKVLLEPFSKEKLINSGLKIWSGGKFRLSMWIFSAIW